MNQYLRYAIYAGLFGVLFIPFIVANGFFFPFIIGKAFAFRIIVEIVFALWVILALRDPSVRPKGSALLYALLAFIVSLGISTLLAENPGKAFWSNFERMEGYISLLHFGAYFLVLSSMLQTQKMWRVFWNTSIGVSVLLALYGAAQLAGVFTINQGGVRVDATFGNATYLAVYMLFNFFITLIALIEWKPKRWQQVAYAVALALQALMIFYTATRGTILGLAGGLFLSALLFIIFAKGQKTLRRAGFALAALILVVSGGFFFVKDAGFVEENPILSRIASISLEEGQTRFTIWGMAWQGFKERPFFGWGQEGFNFVFNKYYEPSLYAQEPWFDRVHNIFLDWLIAGGVFGLAFYLSLFAIALWYLWKPRSAFSLSERALITGLLAGYGFHNLFVFDNLMSYILFFSLFSYLAVRNSAGREEKLLFGGNTLSGGAFFAAAAATVVAATLVLYVANVPGIARASGIIKAIQPYQEGITRNFSEFQKVIGPSGMGRQEAHEQLIQFAVQIRAAQFASASSPEFRDEVAQYAIDRFSEELARQSNDARLQVLFSSFLSQVGLQSEAAIVIQNARVLSPKKQSILFQEATLALQAGDADTALTLFKEAFELDPSYKRARALYAATVLRGGDAALADTLIFEGFDTLAPDDDIILQAYLDTGALDRVVAIAEARVEKSPDNFDRILQLAAAYLAAERRTDAIAALERATLLNPDFKAQGEYYIGEIRAGRNP